MKVETVAKRRFNVFNVSTQLKENQLQNAHWNQERVVVILGCWKP